MTAESTFSVPYESPFDWAFLLDFLRMRQTAGVESISADRYVRTAAAEGDVGIVAVEHRPAGRCLKVTITGPLTRHRTEVEARVRHVFDVDMRHRDVEQVFGADPVIGPLRRAYPGLRIPGAWSPFEALLRTIVGQQVSVAAATTIAGRVAERTAPPLPSDLVGDGTLTRLFPDPDAVAEANLDAIGMPRRRAEALQIVARHVAEGRIAVFGPGAEQRGTGRISVEGTEEIKSSLVELPGIGPWTAEFFALRALGDRDAWPGSDLILRRQVEQRVRRLHPDVDEKELPGLIRRTAERWRPLRAYAAVHLWRAAAEPDDACAS